MASLQPYSRLMACIHLTPAEDYRIPVPVDFTFVLRQFSAYSADVGIGNAVILKEYLTGVEFFRHANDLGESDFVIQDMHFVFPWSTIEEEGVQLEIVIHSEGGNWDCYLGGYVLTGPVDLY